MKRLFTKKLNTGTLILLLGISMLIIYILTYMLKLESEIPVIMIVSILCIVMVGGYNFCQTFDCELLVPYILLLGYVMRIGYMLYTPCMQRPHDINELSINSEGHAAYILNILDGHLPKTNVGQFYHPPLYYILSALVIFVLKPILRLENALDLINCARLVSCFFSCVTLFLMGSICDELKIKKLIPITLVAFLPGLYLMGGCVNNYAIALCFMTMILLYSIKWYKINSKNNTIILALAFGFGMLSKVSVAMLAFPTGLLFLVALWKGKKWHALSSGKKLVSVWCGMYTDWLVISHKKFCAV